MSFLKGISLSDTICVQRYLGTSSLSRFSQLRALDGGVEDIRHLCKQGMREGAALTAISDVQNLWQLPQYVAEFAPTSMENGDVAVHPQFTELLDTFLAWGVEMVNDELGNWLLY